jgi:hypothetical protein
MTKAGDCLAPGQVEDSYWVGQPGSGRAAYAAGPAQGTRREPELEQLLPVDNPDALLEARLACVESEDVVSELTRMYSHLDRNRTLSNEFHSLHSDHVANSRRLGNPRW